MVCGPSSGEGWYMAAVFAAGIMDHTRPIGETSR